MLAVEFFRKIVKRLEEDEILASQLDVDQAELFMQACRRMVCTICEIPEGQPVCETDLPWTLSPSCIKFFCAILGLAANVVERCWAKLRDCILVVSSVTDTMMNDLFREHCFDSGIGSVSVCPPRKQCTRAGCNGAKLVDPHYVQGRFFSLGNGVLPIMWISTYCRSCHTRYYPCYSIKDASQEHAQRVYYSEAEMPGFLQVTETCFIEWRTLDWFEVQIVQSISSSSIAKTYTRAMADGGSTVENGDRLTQQLAQSVVLDGFFVRGLLRHKWKQGEILTLPNVNMANRLDDALNARSYFMAGTGQEMWAHACKGCFRLFEIDGEFYYLRVGVTDGVSVKHTCCSVEEICTVPLSSSKDRFCPIHRDKIEECFVQGCHAAVTKGRKFACEDPEHQSFEDNLIRDTDKAYRELVRRLSRAGTRGEGVSDHCAGNVPETDNVPEAGNVPETDTTTPSAPESVRGHISRKFTNNEQLFILSCGVILSRATMYRSESVSGVKDFLKLTFPEKYPGALPTHIFYDKACLLQKHLRAQGDHYFDDCGFAVDVFHARTKHHEQDEFCNVHANPALFSELRTPEAAWAFNSKMSRWAFNSSICEEKNNWFGAFTFIMQEMSHARFNFFADEIILIQNRMVVELLEKRGYQPFLLPEEFLTRKWPRRSG